MGNKFFNNLVNQDNNVTNDSWTSNEMNNYNELETNKKNLEEFDKVMTNASKKYDSYLDRNNVFVKIILYALLLFILIGCLYYGILWFGNN